MKGIYEIKNTVTGKTYIGSSTNIKRRLTDHKYLLKNNKHHSIHLQRSYNKHGLKSFKFSIIEECNEEKLLEREQFYLDKIYNNSYNIKPTAGSNRGYKHSKDVILKLQRSLGRKVIYQVFSDKSYNEFIFMKNCPDSIGVVRKSIRNRTSPRNKNYYYCYKDDFDPNFDPYVFKVWNKGLSIENNSSKKPVFVYDNSGNYYKSFESLKDAANYFNTTNTVLCRKMNKPAIKVDSKIIHKRYGFYYTPIHINDIV